MVWREKGRATIRAMQMDNLMGLLNTKRIFRISNAWVRELWCKGGEEGLKNE